IWDGSPLQGRRILLHTEQGRGDAIQFVRYARLVTEAGGRVVVGCQPELFRLFQSVSGAEQVITDSPQAPPFDVHCPLLGLPRRLGTRLDSIPNAVPYLHAPPELVEQWRDRLAPGDELR